MGVSGCDTVRGVVERRRRLSKREFDENTAGP